MSKFRFTTLTGMILMAAIARLIPHPPNFTPIAAMALFGGAYFTDKRIAFFVPLMAMFLGDLILGFHNLQLLVYATFAATVCIGLWLQSRKTLVNIAGACMTSSILFFIVTNFGVWTSSGMYPQTIQGLLACYVTAIPFFGHTLLGDALYTTILFGGFALMEKQIPALQEPLRVPG